MNLGRETYPNWWRDFFIFAFAIIYPSTAIFKKVGWLPLLGYVAMAGIGLFIVLKYILPSLGNFLNARTSIGIFLFAILAIAVATWILFPKIQSEHGFTLMGIKFGVSDSDDAFNATWKAMFAGRYPYYEKSFLGNPISPMPGSLFLALPFYILGSTVAQNLVWILVFWIFLGMWQKDLRLASLLMLTVFIFSPDTVYSLIQGWDYLTNSIYILIPAIGILYCLKNQWSPRWTLMCCVLLGVGLSSRANFLMLIPILFFGMIKWSNIRTAIMFMAICLVVFALVTLPFFLYDPAHFTPFHTAGKLDMGGRFPMLPKIIFLVGVAISFFLGVTLTHVKSIEQLIGRCYLVQLFAVLSGFVIASIQIGRPNLDYPHFGVLVLLFGITAVGPGLIRHALGTPGEQCLSSQPTA